MSVRLGAGATEFGLSNTIIIGDSPSDVETGLIGGARVIGVASGSSSIHELREAGASAVLAELTGVDSLISI